MAYRRNSDPLIDLRIKILNFASRYIYTINKANRNCEVFSTGHPQNQYGLVENLAGPIKEGIRITWNIIDKQLNDETLLKLYKELDDAAINYAKAYAETKNKNFFSNEQFRQRVNETISCAETAHSIAYMKVISLLERLTYQCLIDKKSKVKHDLTLSKFELAKLAKKSKDIKKSMTKTELDLNDAPQPIMVKAEQEKYFQQIDSLNSRANDALASVGFALSDIEHCYAPEILKHCAHEAVRYALDYRFSRSKLTPDEKIVTKTNSNPELENLIKQLQEYKASKALPALPPNMAPALPPPLKTPPKKPKK